MNRRLDVAGPVFVKPPCRRQQHLFFASDVFEPKDEREQREAVALAICHRCVYEEPCLEWALTHREWGIWGGTTERDRGEVGRDRVKRRQALWARRMAGHPVADTGP